MDTCVMFSDGVVIEEDALALVPGYLLLAVSTIPDPCRLAIIKHIRKGIRESQT